MPRAKTPAKKGKPSIKNLIKKGKGKRNQNGGAYFPIVGIGASAGGLESFKQFFFNMAPDTGMAFVLVPHLDPSHKSLLSELIQNYTRMQVFEAKETTEIQPNCTYIIPPNRDMELHNRKLHLVTPVEERGLRHSIDYFFRSLAKELKDRAICIIFSGTGTDGTLGLREIKGVGGMAMVQDPKSAQYSGMPQSAIDNAAVDYVLAPSEMPNALLDYIHRSYNYSDVEVVEPSSDIKSQLKVIFDLLDFQKGCDFSAYKENTLLRRIEKRMAICRKLTLADYIEFLEGNSNELECLFQEFLIGVTNFFRDKDAFQSLEKEVLLSLIKNQDERQILRIWIPACSTGEEAYSVAMLFLEIAEALKQTLKMQIFATDIDAKAIEKARGGLYPDNIAVDVSQTRLSRFFEKVGTNYSIRKRVRDRIVFATHNIISDPPFSKMDLICCRNLLIYLRPEIQKRLLSLFHYALNPEGYLFLGNSENISGYESYFTTLHKKWRIFQKKQLPHDYREQLRHFPTIKDRRLSTNHISKAPLEKFNYRKSVEDVLLEIYTPASVLINEKGEILFIRGRTGNYLEPATGLATMNIIEMAREGLKGELTAALRKVVVQKTEIYVKKVKVKTNHSYTEIGLTLRPIKESSSMKGLILVTFEDLPPPLVKPEALLEEPPQVKGDQAIKRLEEELSSTKQYLQATIEELETSNEELKSTNEELESANEELQSTNEELETSKEELQSVNEELITVNSELEMKINELAKAHNDLTNLISSTQIATIFLDTALNIQFFTPSVISIFNLIETDKGRPLQHIVSKIKSINLIKAAESVLETLVPKEMEVLSEDKNWYLVCILPYRTLENKIEGVIITLVNITNMKRVELDLESARQFAENIVDSVRESLLVLDSSRRVIMANRSFYETFQISKKETELLLLDNLSNGQWNIPKLHELLDQVLSNQKPVNNFLVEHNFPKIGHKVMQLNAREIHDTSQESKLILLAIEDITERKAIERALQESEEKFRTLFNQATDIIFIYDLEGHILEANQTAIHYFGFDYDELIQMTLDDFKPLRPSKDIRRHLKDVIQDGQDSFESVFTCKDERELVFEMNTSTIKYGDKTAILNVSRDITKRLKFEKIQRDFVVTASHELRTPISIIIQSLSNINKYKEKLTEESYSNLIKIITRNADNLNNLLKDLLLLTEIDEKGLSLKWEAYKPQSILQKVLDYLEPLYYAREIRIQMNVDENIELLGDVSKIETIFRNLLNNAFKYTDQNGGIKITATAPYQGEYNQKSIDGVLIEFTDTGIGIKNEDIPFLFKRFSRINENFPGTGLGLSIVQELVHRHGGEIYVKSIFKKGSTFSVFLPRYTTPPKK